MGPFRGLLRRVHGLAADPMRAQLAAWRPPRGPPSRASSSSSSAHRARAAKEQKDRSRPYASASRRVARPFLAAYDDWTSPLTSMHAKGDFVPRSLDLLVVVMRGTEGQGMAGCACADKKERRSSSRYSQLAWRGVRAPGTGTGARPNLRRRASSHLRSVRWNFYSIAIRQRSVAAALCINMHDQGRWPTTTMVNLMTTTCCVLPTSGTMTACLH